MKKTTKKLYTLQAIQKIKVGAFKNGYASALNDVQESLKKEINILAKVNVF